MWSKAMKIVWVLILFVITCTSCKRLEDFLVEQPMPIEINSDGKSRILVVSHHTLDANYLDYTWANHRSYARMHHYDYWFRNGVIDARYDDPNGKNGIFKHGLYWQKIAAVEQGLLLKNSDGERTYEWIMWIDADAIFTDSGKTIESVIQESGSDNFLIISHDYGDTCLNTGIWLIKNDDRGRKFIELVKKTFPYFKANQYPEQQAVQDLVYGFVDENTLNTKSIGPYANRTCNDTTIIPGVNVVRQRALNSYYTNYAVGAERSSWQAGDYIAHVAAGGDKRSLLQRLTECMKDKGRDLRGCEIDGAWRE